MSPADAFNGIFLFLVSITKFHIERTQLSRIFLSVASASCLPPLVYIVKWILESMKWISGWHSWSFFVRSGGF